MIQLIIGLVLAAGLATAGIGFWNGFTGSYIAKGAAAQLEADTVILNKAKADVAATAAERDQAIAASATQSSAVAEARKIADEAVKAARQQSILYAEAVAKGKARDAALRATAAAPPTVAACEKLLSTTDSILRESGRIRQGVK